MGLKEFFEYCLQPTKEKTFTTFGLMALYYIVSTISVVFFILVLYNFGSISSEPIKIDSLFKVITDLILQNLSPPITRIIFLALAALAYPGFSLGVFALILFFSPNNPIIGSALLILAIGDFILNSTIIYAILYPFGCFIVRHKSWKKGIALLCGTFITIILGIVIFSQIHYSLTYNPTCNSSSECRLDTSCIAVNKQYSKGKCENIEVGPYCENKQCKVFDLRNVSTTADCRKFGFGNINEYGNEFQNECYFRLAVIKDDAKICENMTSGKVYSCYIDFAIQKKDINLCDKFFVDNPRHKSLCYSSVPSK